MRWPAEWEPHEAVWIGFPGDPAEWPVGLAEAQREVAAFASAVSDGGAGEQAVLVCRNETDVATAGELSDKPVETIVAPFGDIWIRDTGAIITVEASRRMAHDFCFNGWGRKFEMEGDQDIGSRLAVSKGLPLTTHDWVLEGGAVDGDGEGLLLTTEQCALNANRNEAFSKSMIEDRLREALGINQFCWLENGLANDHTDGHVDNLARFVAFRTVAIPEADQADDPNRVIFDDAAARIEQAGLRVIRLPSVGKHLIDGQIAPASYMNFYIGNRVVVVPQYCVPNDNKAVEDIAALFPDRKVVGLPSTALLRGGGSFHCISQQIPAV